MDFRQLESFLSIATHKSFSRAAKELYLTQPTLSNHMQNLEKELGVMLLNRNNREISLTRAGELFFDYAQDILKTKQSALFNLGQYIGKIEGRLELYASTIPEQYILPGVMQAFSQEYPYVSYKIHHQDSFDILTGISEGKLPYGFAGTYIRDPSLVYVPVIEDNLVFIAPPDFGPSEISVKDLKKLPLILREEGSGTRRCFSEALKSQKTSLYDLNIRALAENTQTIKMLVQSGLGCAVISEKAIETELTLGSLCTFKVAHMDMQRKFYFVQSRTASLSEIEESFIEFLSKSFMNPS